MCRKSCVASWMIRQSDAYLWTVAKKARANISTILGQRIFVSRDVIFKENSVQPIAEFKIQQANENYDVFEGFLPIAINDADLPTEN